MAVTTEVTLPAQPASGSTLLHPLGGNGFHSPHSVYHGLVNSSGDASGGDHIVRVYLDNRYLSLVATFEALVQGMSADLVADLFIVEETGSSIALRTTAAYLPVGSLASDAVIHWNPEPFLISANSANQSEIRLLMANTNGIDLTIRYHIYNFDKMARHRIPIEVLSRCLVRSSSVT